MKINHILTGLLVILFGVILVIISDNYIRIEILTLLLSNLGSAIIAVGIIEVIFKTFLQKDLIRDIISELKSELQSPFKASFLRRKELSEEYQILNLINLAKEEIIIKAVALRVNKNISLFNYIENQMVKNNKLIVKILLLNPKNEIICKAHADFVGLTVEELLGSLKSTVDDCNNLKNRFGDRFKLKYYETFPTSGIIMIDPSTSSGIVKLEVAIIEKSALDENINLIFKKDIDEAYFEAIYKSLNNYYLK